MIISERDKEIQKHLKVEEDLRQEIQKLSLNFESSNVEAKSLNDKLQTCQEQLRGAKLISLRLNKDLMARGVHITVLKSQNTKQKEKIREEEDEKRSLLAELKDLSRVKEEQIRKINALEQKVRELKDRKQKQIEVITMQLKEENSTLMKHKEEKEAIKGLMTTIRKLNSETQVSKELLKEQETEIETKGNVCTRLSRELGLLFKEKKEQDEKIKLLTSQKMDMKVHITHLNNVVSELQNTIKTLEKMKQNIEDDKRSLKIKLQKEKGEAHQIRNSELQMEMKVKNTNLRLLEALRFQQRIVKSTQGQTDKIYRLESEIDSLQEQVADLNHKNRKTSLDLKGEQKKNGALVKEIESKENESFMILKSLDAKDQELQTQKNNLQSILDDMKAKDLKISAMAEELITKKENINELEKDVAKFKQTLTQKEDEIKIFRIEMHQLFQSLSLTKKHLQNTESLQKEINNFKKLYEKERLKCKALEDEIQKPKNHHRWRMMEGAGSSTGHLFEKNLHLQKELQRKTDTLRKMEIELETREKMIEELREEKKKWSESNLEEQLWRCQKDIKTYKSKIKSLLGEQNMSESLLSKHQNEILHLKSELVKIKQLNT